MEERNQNIFTFKKLESDNLLFETWEQVQQTKGKISFLVRKHGRRTIQ